MVKLSEFKRDTKAIQDGIWVRVNTSEYGDLEICTRGYTDAFIDAQTARQIKLAAPYGGNQALIPNAELRKLNAQLLREFLLLDVRNLVDDETGQPVTREEFLAMVEDPRWALLLQASFAAAARVTRQSASQETAAEGNSEAASSIH